MLVLYIECLGMVKLVIELHHVNQRGDQEEFQDSKASMWALLCESRR